MAEPELPPARLHSASAESVALAHVLHGGRHALRIGRWLWTALMAAVCIGYVVYHLIPRPPPKPREERLLPINPDLLRRDRYEVVEVPSPTGHGTIEILAPKQPHAQPPTTTEPQQAPSQSP